MIARIGFVCCLIVLPLAASQIFAQGGDTLVRVKVVDPNGSPISKARITVNGAISRVPVAATTDRSGLGYVNLASGDYAIVISAEGFATTSRIIKLRDKSPTDIEIILPVATLDETVTVTDSSAQAVTSATKTLTALSDVPQSITVIAREKIG